MPLFFFRVDQTTMPLHRNNRLTASGAPERRSRSTPRSKTVITIPNNHQNINLVMLNQNTKQVLQGYFL